MSSPAKKPSLTTVATSVAVASAAAATVVPRHGLIYMTLDVYTSPPTTLAIVASEEDAHRAHMCVPEAYVITTDDMEMNKGWLDALEQLRRDPNGFTAHHQSSLNVCFHHAFGRCRGRQHGDPATCQQLHVNPAALHQVRGMYRHPVRPFFVRAFSAVLPLKAQQCVQRISQRRGVAAFPTILEFTPREVAPTSGAHQVDNDFRQVLLDPTHRHRQLRANPLHLCLPFSVGLPCAFGESCVMLHAPLSMTHTSLSPQHRHVLTEAIAELSLFLRAAMQPSAPSTNPWAVNAALPAIAPSHMATHTTPTADIAALPPPPSYFTPTAPHAPRPQHPVGNIAAAAEGHQRPAAPTDPLRTPPSQTPEARGPRTTPVCGSFGCDSADTRLLSDLAVYLGGTPATGDAKTPTGSVVG